MAKKSQTILLVEGESDVKFFEALIKYSNIDKLSFDFNKVQFDVIGGSDSKKLTNAIRLLKTDILNSPIISFGIILDRDEYSEEDRQLLVYNVLKNLFGEENVKVISKAELKLFINDKKTVNVFTHFIEDEIINNLEMLLKAIVAVEPTAANCLELWYNCITAKGRKIRKSDYLKIWREVYIRYDYCSNRELSGNASENCTTDKSYDNMLISDKLKAWNFNAIELEPLKGFLQKFAM